MELAKPHLDVGCFTNRQKELDAFYSEEMGLPFEGVLHIGPLAPLGAEVDQYRYELRGSVLKVNQCGDPLAAATSAYRRLVVATEGVTEPVRMSDPDGLEVELVPLGHGGVTGIGVVCAVSDTEAWGRFLTSALGAEPLGPGRYRVGETVLALEAAPAQPRSGPIRARGLTYLTIQVRDVVGAHRRLGELGVEVATPPTRVGDVAAVCFVRDPGGSWIELAQRAALAGPLPDLDS
ncbi:MAG: VOC family protein [Actinomycetota bacterium]|nr:VOC family protein [Actinomycetota bacterium]